MLREKHLVIQDRDLYRLSEIGKIIVEKMNPLLDTLSVLEENTDYWVDRDISKIPPFLLRRIGELGHCITIEPQIEHMFEMIPDYVRNAEEAKKFEALISYFHPLFFLPFISGLQKRVHRCHLFFPNQSLEGGLRMIIGNKPGSFLKWGIPSSWSAKTVKRLLTLWRQTTSWE